MGQFFDELKRRNVLRVAIAYLAASWLLIQIVETLFPVFGVSDAWIRLVVIVLTIGFPLILIFSWLYELTPEGFKSEEEIERSRTLVRDDSKKLDRAIIIVLALALGYFGFDKFLLSPQREAALIESATQAGAQMAWEKRSAIPDESIAVLPFVNMSDDPGNEYFSDGLSEEILNLLAKVPELKVIGRTSSFAFKGKSEDLRVIGQTLGVKTVLEGSVRKSGERVRITLKLIDVSDGSQIWSETYERMMTDIFAVQDDVAAAVIDALQIHVGANPTRGRPTENTEAYVLFLKARALLSMGEIQDAEELVLKAIELDPNFAEAYELLAFSYYNQLYLFKATEVQKLTGEAAAKALAIDPDLVLAQAMYQSANIENWSLLGEIEAFERVLREQPGNSQALDALFWNLMIGGYFEEGVRLAERYVELDPLLLTGNSHLVVALDAAGRTREAIAALEVLNQLNPDGANWESGDQDLVGKRDDIAIAHFEAYLQYYGYPDSTWVRELVTAARNPATGQAYLDRRIPEIIASMPEEEAVEWQGRLTRWYLRLGFLDRYFELIIDIGITDSAWSDAFILVIVATISRRSGFTAHPRYLEVADSMGIIDVWEQRGPPDFCDKTSGQWVCN